MNQPIIVVNGALDFDEAHTGHGFGYFLNLMDVIRDNPQVKGSLLNVPPGPGIDKQIFTHESLACYLMDVIPEFFFVPSRNGTSDWDTDDANIKVAKDRGITFGSFPKGGYYFDLGPFAVAA